MVGFSTTNFTRAWEPTLSWNHLRSEPGRECNGDITTAIQNTAKKHLLDIAAPEIVCNRNCGGSFIQSQVETRFG